MDEEKKKEIAKQEFLEKADNYKQLMEYREKFFEHFLNVKLAFLSFVGIIIAIVFAQKADFSHRFLIILLLILIVTFFLLALEVFLNFIDRTRALKKQWQRTILAKIRHIAILRDKFVEYGKQAEELLIQENEIEQKMFNKESLNKIVRYSSDKFSWFIFVIWLVIIIGVPIIFLFEILGKL